MPAPFPAGDLQAIDEARWRDAWNLKVFGYINLCRAVYPAMKARGGGVIVNVLGAAGERPTWGYIAGSAGNASLMAFTRGMGGTSLVDRIRIVACNPGLIRTERMETMLRASAQAKFGDADALAGADPDQSAGRHARAVRRSRGVSRVRPGLAHRRDGRDDRRRGGALQRGPVEPRMRRARRWRLSTTRRRGMNIVARDLHGRKSCPTPRTGSSATMSRPPPSGRRACGKSSSTAISASRTGPRATTSLTSFATTARR